MPWHLDNQISRNSTEWSSTRENRFRNYFHAKMTSISDDSYDYRRNNVQEIVPRI